MGKIIKGKINLFLILLNVLLIVVLIIAFTSNTKPEYTASSVFERIVDIQEISLVQYNYTGVVGFEDRKTVADINVPFTRKHFLVKYDGYIKGGIDFDEIDIEVFERRVSVRLPKPRIIDNVIDESSLVVYDESNNIFNPIKIEDYNDALIMEKAKMEQEAMEKGILDRVQSQATSLINTIVIDMGFEEIDISFK